jgi:hypothetical protein
MKVYVVIDTQFHSKEIIRIFSNNIDALQFTDGIEEQIIEEHEVIE